MKRALMAISATALLIVCASCAQLTTLESNIASALTKVDPNTASYEAGKITTVLYATQQNKFTQQQRDAVVQVWTIFKEATDGLQAPSTAAAGTVVTSASIDPNTFEQMILAQIKIRVTDPTMQAFALDFTDTAWNALVSKVNLAGLQQNEFVTVILNFRRGIETGLSFVSVSPAATTVVVPTDPPAVTKSLKR